MALSERLSTFLPDKNIKNINEVVMKNHVDSVRETYVCLICLDLRTTVIEEVTVIF